MSEQTTNYGERTTIKIGTRPSRLALKQVEEVMRLLPARQDLAGGGERNIRFEVKRYNTSGDKDKATPISKIEGGDFFTKEIDEALLRGEIDLAVHSAKDLPDNLAPGLFIAAITKSIDPFDVLVAKDDLKLPELKPGAKIGTSSLRRKTQLKNYRKDFQIVDIRGNIEERLELLNETDLDAIVIAAAGLLRLGLGYRITQRIPFEILKPHPLQGALAVEAREDDKEMIDLFSELDTRER